MTSNQYSTLIGMLIISLLTACGGSTESASSSQVTADALPRQASQNGLSHAKNNGPANEDTSTSATQSNPTGNGDTSTDTTQPNPTGNGDTSTDTTQSNPAGNEDTSTDTTQSNPAGNEDTSTDTTQSNPAGLTSLPLNMSATALQQATISLNIIKPFDAFTSAFTLTVLDANTENEGEVIINGNDPIALFKGPSPISQFTGVVRDVVLQIPASYWIDGNNTVTFKYLSSEGYTVQNLDVAFQPEVFAPKIVLSADNVGFGTQGVGAISDPVPVTLTNEGNAPLNISDISVSSDFIETNNCSNFVPAGSECTINISFIPVTAGNYSGTLNITSDDTSNITQVYLAGITSNTDNSNSLLHVDFNENSIGAYASADIIKDFQVGMNGYNDYLAGTDYNSIDIVTDPANTGRGNVMRVKHSANTGGNGADSGGMTFRADFEKQEDVYLAYDLYLPLDHEWTKIVKNPGLITGTMLQASHGSTAPEPEGLVAFTSLITSDSPPAWPNRGYGALSAYYYNADEVQRNQFWNEVDPNSEDSNDQYNQPIGRWITIEMRVKMNTVTEEGVSGLKDGLLEIWVTDPQSWTGAHKVSSDQHKWRFTNSMGADGIWMVNYYGGKAGDSDNRPSKDNYHYYDNFIVSTTPITH